MKNVFLTIATLAISYGCFAVEGKGNGDIGSVGGSRQNAEFVQKIEMEQYLIAANNVKSVDVLVDYEKVWVDCNGLATGHEATSNEVSRTILIEKTILATTRMACTMMHPMKQVQAGLKLNIKASGGAVYQYLLAPTGSKVEFLKRK